MKKVVNFLLSFIIIVSSININVKALDKVESITFSNIKIAHDRIIANYKKKIYAQADFTLLTTRLKQTQTLMSQGKFRNETDCKNLISRLTAIQKTVNGININARGYKIVGSATKTEYAKAKAELTRTISQANSVLAQIQKAKQSNQQGSNQQQGYRTVYVYNPNYEILQRVSQTPLSGYTAIKVKYGWHTYGVRSQAEYDKVVSTVEQIYEKSGLKNVKTFEDLKNYMLQRGGKTEEDRQNILKEYQMILDYHQGKVDYWYTGGDNPERYVYWISSFEEAPRMTSNDLLTLIKYNILWGDVADFCDRISGGDGNSAYDLMFRSTSNCQGYAHRDMLVADVMGINSRMVGVDSLRHAYAEIQIGGKWYNAELGSYMLGEDKYKDFNGKDKHIYVEATNAKSVIAGYSTLANY